MDIKFDAASIIKIIRQKSYVELSLYIRGNGYKRLFFNHSPIGLKYLIGVFGVPNTKYDSFDPTKRWLIDWVEPSGTWVAFKSDQDAIHYKLMGFGNPELWEIA